MESSPKMSEWHKEFLFRKEKVIQVRSKCAVRERHVSEKNLSKKASISFPAFTYWNTDCAAILGASKVCSLSPPGTVFESQECFTGSENLNQIVLLMSCIPAWVNRSYSTHAVTHSSKKIGDEWWDGSVCVPFRLTVSFAKADQRPESLKTLELWNAHLGLISWMLSSNNAKKWYLNKLSFCREVHIKKQQAWRAGWSARR